MLCGVKFHSRKPRRGGSHFATVRKEEASSWDIAEPKAACQQSAQNPSPYLCTWPATAARGTWFSAVTLKEREDSGVLYLHPLLSLDQVNSATLPWL